MARYTRKIINDYCVLDLETTGLSVNYCNIIEVGIIKVKDRKVIDKFQSLVNPEENIDEFIEDLTGITNEMLIDAPRFHEIEHSLVDFLHGYTIVGHNTSFDIAFLEEALKREIDCEYIDTMQLSRKLFPEMNHHRLSDMVELLGISENGHRAIKDCYSTFELYERIKDELDARGIDLSNLFYRKRKERLNLNEIERSDDSLIDEDCLLFNKHCCFTGTLEKMTRKEAAQIVVNIGGFVDSSVTKNTNYLIMGNLDYCKSIKDGSSNKMKKAMNLKLKGMDIDIIDENTFYRMLPPNIDL